MTTNRTTRRPTGTPPWPMLCLAGVEKSGKSYSGALFSGSDLIDRTFWIEIGEGAADQYGAIPGARYEIVEHDGTAADIAAAVVWAVNQPRPAGKPHAIVIDSMTEYWDLLSDEAQAKANKRRGNANGEAQITMDLWNAAKKTWRRTVDALRTYDGPVVLLCRLEQVAVIENGKPVAERRDWKVRAEKNLVFECDGVVKLYAPQAAYLTGLRSTVLQVPPGSELELPAFTIDGLLRAMGLDAAGATAPRAYTAPKAVVEDDEGPERPAERRTGPVRDQWNDNHPVPTVSEGQLEKISKLLGSKRGVFNGDRIGALIKLAGRELDNPTRLTSAEANRIIETLTAEPDHVPAKPAPASGAQLTALNAMLSKRGITERPARLAFLEQAVGRKLVSSKDLTKAEASRIIDQLGPEPIEASLGVDHYTALVASIEQAQTSGELADVSESFWKAKDDGHLTEQQLSALIDRSQAREAELAQARRAAA